MMLSALRLTKINLYKHIGTVNFWTPFILAIAAVYEFTSSLKTMAMYYSLPVNGFSVSFIFTNLNAVFIIFIGVFIIFSDLPFRDNQQMFLISRSGKRAWIFSQVLYVVFVSLVYITFIFVCFCIILFPFLGFDVESWGKIIRTIASPNAMQAFDLVFTVPQSVISDFSPLEGFFFSFGTVFAISVILGHIVLLFNLTIKHNTGVIISGAMVFMYMFVHMSGSKIMYYFSSLNWCSIFIADKNKVSAYPDVSWIITVLCMLDEYMKLFEQHNKNMKVFNAVLHLDEATPHLHIDFVPICTNQTRGLSTRVSLKRALAEQGITAQSRKKSEWALWIDVEFECMTEILRKHGFERDVKNDSHAHLTVDEYKEQEKIKAEIRQLNAHINELKKKPENEFTADDAVLLNNQNDHIRQKFTELQQEVDRLNKQLGAKFIPLTVLNPDKLQYAADGLTRAKIPHIAESTTLYIPDYAVKTFREIISHYAPIENAATIREQIALDIDCLIYSSVAVEDLLNRVQSLGYEIKRGKYISVKHPNAKRFVRLNTLGDDYCCGRLEQRILSRNDFTNSMNEKIRAASHTEQLICTEILSITTKVKPFQLEPKKVDKARIYTFHNDAHIDYLVKQLNTIAEFGLTDRERIVKKGCEIMENINEIRAEGNNPAPEREKLARINELLKVYDELIEGNYIDNLIKAQQGKQSPQSKPKQQKHHKH